MKKKLGTFFFKTRSYTPVPFLFLFIFFSAPTPATLAVGAALMMTGEIIRFWGVGYAGFVTRTRNVGASSLVTSGPFSLVRNPLYLGNFVLSLGACVALNALMPWALFCFVLLFFVQYFFIIQLEEETLEHTFGEPYRDYKSSVPRFFPGLNRYQKPSEHKFDGRMSLKSERNTFASIFIILLVGAAFWIWDAPLLQWIKSFLSG